MNSSCNDGCDRSIDATVILQHLQHLIEFQLVLLVQESRNFGSCIFSLIELNVCSPIEFADMQQMGLAQHDAEAEIVARGLVA